MRIRVPKVRCIDQNGNMAGVLTIGEALKLAQHAGLDLVEISPNADPPVCRVMDFGKFKYEESIKEKEARKRQHSVVVKEMKFHSNVGDHDYMTKVAHTKDFLEKGCKVKLSLTFRGRENAHRDLGFAVVNRVLKDCLDVAVVEMAPRMMGHSVIAMLAGRKGLPPQGEPRRNDERPAAVPRPAPAAKAPEPAAPKAPEPVAEAPIPQSKPPEPVAQAATPESKPPDPVVAPAPAGDDKKLDDAKPVG